ncbi:type II toxin-antitoxin system ParD family antitoxin [Acidisoma silvae]|uniref:Type II toxin-antitoxin system ParD family antitoxin n=1 Tax=Acidisoma silvae TaxID=2802396 RepID=A0A963YY26_9PROT|nr:type II toxin-antitoxin system ParD family antitoxin [Acidisoma silvae]MCB8878412.1 type II toxin-antitoxin system ParD family antitoxin [Acidisoma silvae]
MSPKASLNVSLTPQLMAYVDALVGTGRYQTASEVLRAGLRLLQREENAPMTPIARVVRKQSPIELGSKPRGRTVRG